MSAPPRDDASPAPAPELRANAASELDPELLRLPRPRPSTGPLLALALIILCGTLMQRMYADFQFANEDTAPKEVQASLLATEGPALLQRYITVVATPDRATTVRIAGDKDSGHRLMPLIGTSGKIWLQISGQSFFTRPKYDERYTGRLRTATELGLVAPMSKLLPTLPPLPRFFDPLTFQPGAQATTRTGETIALPTDATVIVVQRVPQIAFVTFVATDRIVTRADAAAVLLANGLSLAPDEVAPPDTDQTWTFAVTADAGAKAVQETLAKARYFGVSVVEKTLRHEGPASTLLAKGSALELGASVVPRADIAELAILVAPTFDPSALVFVDGEIPKQVWYIPLFFAGLGLVSLLMLWSLWRSVRP